MLQVSITSLNFSLRLFAQERISCHTRGAVNSAINNWEKAKRPCWREKKNGIRAIITSFYQCPHEIQLQKSLEDDKDTRK